MTGHYNLLSIPHFLENLCLSAERKPWVVGTAPLPQDSGGGSSQHSGDQDGSNYNSLRKSSTSGDEKQDIPIRKPGFDRDKNRAAQRAFRMRKKEKEKARPSLSKVNTALV